MRWLVAGILFVFGLYLAARLFILDRINRETPHQEDPKVRETERF